MQGFEIKGHSGYGEEGNDIVCSAVSSAAYLTANTVTDILGIKARAQASEGSIALLMKAQDAPRADAVMRGLELHINALAEQYPDNLQVLYTDR